MPAHAATASSVIAQALQDAINDGVHTTVHLYGMDDDKREELLTCLSTRYGFERKDAPDNNHQKDAKTTDMHTGAFVSVVTWPKARYTA